ncbi:general secretion pathway protein GspK [Bdellovibrio sp. qaytius]|nr:general secretion pathway protein GspK [Bdellovibrio sp. qaytius]
MLAMTTLILMIWVASEVSTDSTIEYVVNSQEINRIKAFYSARSSLDLALLRIKVYQQASRMPLPPGFAQQINMIWSFPFAWPLPIAAETSLAAKDDIEGAAKASIFDGQYTHTITDEGSKLDINDLASPSKTLREITKKQVLTIFEGKLQNDDKFREVYANYNFTELVNRIADWMSDKNSSENGGDKRQAFRELGENFPPNRGFRTLDEMRLVPGMTEEFFNLMSPSITIYGSKAINPNTAAKDVLKSLDPNMTDDAARDAVERRDDEDKGGQYKGASSDECRTDYKNFIEGRGVRLNPDFDKIPFQCDTVVNFKIEAIGMTGSGKGAVQKKITAYVMNVQKAAATIKSYLDKERKEAEAAQGQPGQRPPPQTGQTSPTKTQEALPKGRPRIVYWSEQ